MNVWQRYFTFLPQNEKVLNLEKIFNEIYKYKNMSLIRASLYSTDFSFINVLLKDSTEWK